MAKILIKRTSGTTKPSTVDAGELVYAYGSGGDYGGKLFLGHGSNSSSSPVIVGGELYTNMLDHTAGTTCLLYTSPSPRDRTRSRMPSSA